MAKGQKTEYEQLVLVMSDYFITRSYTATANKTFTFNSLTASTIYRVKATETNSGGETKDIADTELITPAQ